MRAMRLVATGRCLPQRVVTNDDLSRMVETSDEWISTRTGIRERRHCTDETNAFLASEAARRAMAQGGISPEEIGICIVATFTPDSASPSMACLVQQALGLPEDIPAFDLNAACSGFLYGLKVAHGLLLTSERPYALVVGSEVLSRVVNFEDRGTCVLFGDGAGAAVLTLSDSHRFVAALGARGDDSLIHCPGPGKPDQYISMNGREVFRFATDIIPRCIEQVLAKAGLTLEDVDYVVCHQANARIISHVVKKMQAPEEKFYINLQRYGNTSSASIPIALDEMAEQGLLRPGMRVVCVGFGGGLTWGGALLEW